MKKKGKIIKDRKLTILVTLAVIFALIFLGGSQALSKGKPWKPNYIATVDGHINGDGEVEIKRDRVSSGRGDNFGLDFEEIAGETIWNTFSGFRLGWLSISISERAPRGSSFHYSWSEGEVDYSLTGWGSFEYNKKEERFIFLSEGYYKLTEWPTPEPSVTVWEGELLFHINGTPLPE